MQPYSLRRPEPSLETPLIVEVPHAGLHAPASVLAQLEVSARSLAEDADLHVDALYDDAAELGASLLVCHLSRYVVDMNRNELDVDGLTVQGRVSQHAAIRGVVWRESGRGERVLRRPLREDEFSQRLRDYHRPYHAQLQQLIAEKQARFGLAVVLAAHSMPSRTDRHGAVADVVPGSRGGTSCDPSLLQRVEQLAHGHNLSVRHDVPYRGGYTTGHYGRPSSHVHVVQIELARRLYMDEGELSPHQGFAATRGFCNELVRALGQWRPDGATARPLR